MIIRNIFGLAVVIYSLCCTNDSKQINLPSPDNLCLIDNEHTKFDKCPLLAIWGESLWGMKEVTGPELLALKRTSVWFGAGSIRGLERRPPASVPNMLLRSILLLLSLVCIFSTALEEEEMEGVVKKEVKKPKLFYVSTLSTTSTVSTLTVCYVTSATLATCTAGKRRKRRIELDEPAGTILPTTP